MKSDALFWINKLHGCSADAGMLTDENKSGANFTYPDEVY